MEAISDVALRGSPVVALRVDGLTTLAGRKSGDVRRSAFRDSSRAATKTWA